MLLCKDSFGCGKRVSRDISRSAAVSQRPAAAQRRNPHAAADREARHSRAPYRPPLLPNRITHNRGKREITQRRQGHSGTVVHIYRDGLAYEVEFTTLDGHTGCNHGGSFTSSTRSQRG